MKLRYPNKVRFLVSSMPRRVSQALAYGRKPARLEPANRERRRSESGVTLLELIIATSILLVLASAALPVVRFSVQRKKEAQLHKALRDIRNAIDSYKDYADRNLIRVEVGSEGYAGPGNARETHPDWRRFRPQGSLLAPHPCGPHDRTHGMEFAVRPGRPGLHLLGRQERF